MPDRLSPSIRQNLLVMLGAGALQAASFGIYETGLPLFLDHLGISLLGMGLIFGISQLGILALRFFVGSHSDNRGRKPFFAFSLGLSAAASVITPLWPSPLIMLLIKTAHDTAGMLRELLRSVIVYEQSRQRFMRWISRIVGIELFFMALGAVTAGTVIHAFGYETAFIIAGICSFLALILVWAWFRDRKANAARQQVQSSWNELFRFDLPWNLWVLAILSLVLGTGVMCSHSFYLLLFFQKKFAFSMVALGLLQMGHRFSLGLPMVFVGRFLDRADIKKHYKTVFLVAALLQGASIAATALIPTALLACAVFTIHDIVGATFYVPIQNYFIQLYARPERRGSDVALVTGISSLGSVFGPLLAGYAADRLQWRDGPFLLSGLIVMASAAGILLLKGQKNLAPSPAGS